MKIITGKKLFWQSHFYPGLTNDSYAQRRNKGGVAAALIVTGLKAGLLASMMADWQGHLCSIAGRGIRKMMNWDQQRLAH